MKTNRVLRLLLALVLAVPQVAAAYNAEIDSLLLSLDKHLEESHLYVEKKEERINDWRRQFFGAVAPEKRYEAGIRLFEEYKSYKYDSAYSYARQALMLAYQLHNPGYEVEANCAISFCLVSSGLFKEAFDVIGSVDITHAPLSSKITYYDLYSRLYFDVSDYNGVEPYRADYVKQGSLYTDTLLSLIPRDSQQYYYAVGQRYMKQRNFHECVNVFKEMLDKFDLDPHLEAIITSCIGWIYGLQGDADSSLAYLIRAAINDIRSATKETTALCTLANILYRRGDVNRANRYIKLALEDANFYNARHRKIAVGSILPLIEQDRFETVEKQRNVLMGAILLITLLFALLLATTIIIYKQVKKLRNARKTIGERNEQLQDTNRLLSEANNIKVEYIGYSLYLNSEYIAKMENLHKTINRKITARQFDDLRTLFKESTLDKERDNMYTSFDETFLKIFPGFIAAWNSLFPEAERTRTETDRTLTPEMRIFALIRLGICESERIAKFLNYSVHTINTYKTRVKNKSLVSNEEFEARIMQIAAVAS